MNQNPIKRLLCRTIFLAIGILPLVGTGGWAAYRGLNQSSTSYGQWVSEQFGLECNIQKVVHARPGTTRFEGLSFQDTESLTRLAQCNEAVVQSNEFAREIRIPALSVAENEFRRLLELLDERVLQNPRMLNLPTAVQIDELTIESKGSRTVTLRDIRLDTSLTDVGPQANMEFVVVPENGGGPSEPIRMDVIRETAEADGNEVSLPPVLSLIHI